jgi:hypothetical protein
MSPTSCSTKDTFGKKRVAIPISAVAKIGYEARLSLTKDEVRDLPELSVDESI